MNRRPIYCHAKAVLEIATLLVLCEILVGCAPETKPHQPAAPASVENSSSTGPIQAAVQPATATVASGNEQAEPAAAQPAPAANEETVKLGSCDGENSVAVSKDLTGQALAETLMDQWKRDHPDSNWVNEEKAKHAFLPPAENADLLQDGQGKSHTYGNYSEQDVLAWARETEKFVAEGSRIFHDAGALGSTVAVSCDMCHPHASNTHPETYPKFQVQLGRGALLRDMINWCVENPVRGERLDPDGATMRALEAYIQAQRKGVMMNYGKH